MRRSSPRRQSFARRKRSVSWIPGWSGLDTSGPVPYKSLALAGPLEGNAGSVGAAIFLTSDADLGMHGGEDCVIYRIQYELTFFGMSFSEATALVVWPFRLLVVQADTTLAGTGLMSFDYTTGGGLGRDDILHTRDFMAAVGNLQYGGGGSTAVPGGPNDYWIRGDIRVRRKIQSDRHLALWVQTTKLGTITPTYVQFAGHLRSLMARPK